jgi:hypothetical protein
LSTRGRVLGFQTPFTGGLSQSWRRI